MLAERAGEVCPRSPCGSFKNVSFAMLRGLHVKKDRQEAEVWRIRSGNHYVGGGTLRMWEEVIGASLPDDSASCPPGPSSRTLFREQARRQQLVPKCGAHVCWVNTEAAATAKGEERASRRGARTFSHSTTGSSPALALARSHARDRESGYDVAGPVAIGLAHWQNPYARGRPVLPPDLPLFVARDACVPVYHRAFACKTDLATPLSCPASLSITPVPSYSSSSQETLSQDTTGLSVSIHGAEQRLQTHQRQSVASRPGSRRRLPVVRHSSLPPGRRTIKMEASSSGITNGKNKVFHAVNPLQQNREDSAPAWVAVFTLRALLTAGSIEFRPWILFKTSALRILPSAPLCLSQPCRWTPSARFNRKSEVGEER
ncbi:hypothetical protein H920_08333 [Fukomys damarensis]|uniref:Uncharacterized protein n=1 Tax=Fukomys damarensis TaxID=885580 RepID=A0A091DGW1_FUKDA|nr:hypothetical protein H920_08333 [Fukomys damarensis]